MKALTISALVFAVALAQVTVAPLFPFAGAVAELPLVALLVLTMYAGPATVMLALPLMAICVGFAAGREPGLLVIAYLPLLPIAVGLEGSPIPLNPYARVIVVGAAMGIWVRSLFALAAVIQGATLGSTELFAHVLVPGLLLDLALVTVVYVTCRLIGLSGRDMTLQRGGY